MNTNKALVSQDRMTNQQTLTTAISNGFTHLIRTKTDYFFFRSQSAMTRRLNQIGGDPVRGQMSIYNLCWFD